MQIILITYFYRGTNKGNIFIFINYLSIQLSYMEDLTNVRQNAAGFPWTPR